MIPFETIDMSKYQAAVQHPQHAFSEPDLVSKRVFKNSLGWPAAQSGNFAIVYRLVGRNRITSKEEVVAVRCFKKLAPDLAHRYEQICNVLDSAAPTSKYLLRTRYLAQGIKIDTGWKPVTTLPWVEGVSLDRHFDTAHTKMYEMDRLRSQIRELARELESAGIAHCDLQHRNVMVDLTGTIRLIDYDGMFVPTLKGQRTNELGHPDFQHPGRDDGAIFGPSVDRFSLISIYLQTYAVGRHPELWVAKERTEGLLLRREDYLDPDGSATLRALRAHDDLREPVDLFRRICAGTVADVPSLTSFLKDVGLAGRLNAPQGGAGPVETPARPPAPAAPPAPVLRSAAPTLYMPVIRAERVELASHAGDEAMVIGQFTHAQYRTDAAGRRATSIFLSTLGAGSFSVLVEGPTARQFAALGKGWTVRAGRWLAATGLLLSQGTDYAIQVDQIAQLERLDEQEAHRRLNMRQWSTGTQAQQVRAEPQPKTKPPKAPIAEPARWPAGPAVPPPEVRGGHLVFKDFRQLGDVFGRTGKHQTDAGKKEQPSRGMEDPHMLKKKDQR